LVTIGSQPAIWFNGRIRPEADGQSIEESETPTPIADAESAGFDFLSRGAQRG